VKLSCGLLAEGALQNSEILSLADNLPINPTCLTPTRLQVTRTGPSTAAPSGAQGRRGLRRRQVRGSKSETPNDDNDSRT
jgi:hypothetical protein